MFLKSRGEETDGWRLTVPIGHAQQFDSTSCGIYVLKVVLWPFILRSNKANVKKNVSTLFLKP